MIANPSSSLNTALRGGAAASGQPLTSAPAARSGTTSAPASTEFSRMLEHNQTAARQTQAAIQARQAARGAASAPVDQTTQPASPATAAAPEPATVPQDPVEASAAGSAAVPGDASRSARAVSARDKAGPARTARADAGESTDAKASSEAAAEPEDATALVLPAAPGQPVLPAATVMVSLATVTPGETAPAGDADPVTAAGESIDAALAGVACGKPGPRDAASVVRADAAKAVRPEAAATAASDAQTDLHEAANAMRADAPLPGAAARGAAAPEDASLMTMNAVASRDLPMPLMAARELSERPAANAPEATPDAALAVLARSALSEPSSRKAAVGDAASPAAFGIALANVQAARAGDVSTPVIAQASVATPFTDPGFQQALGYQVSLLARDGIGQAELHLNPTDMGPVSVQITMTGDQARVDFGADLAQTRQLLEAGWAELASSLKDAGFTLSGGGVSDHARERQTQQGQGASQSFGGRSGRDAGEASAVAPVVARRVNGGVDVYA